MTHSYFWGSHVSRKKSFATPWLRLPDIFSFLRILHDIFFQPKHMLDIFWGISTTPIKNQMVHSLSIHSSFQIVKLHNRIQRTNAYSVKKIYLFLESNDQYGRQKNLVQLCYYMTREFSSTFSRTNRQTSETSIPIQKSASNFKGTCLRKEASVYFAANPTGYQVHNRRHPFSDILKNFANKWSRTAAGKSETSPMLPLLIDDKHR